MPPQHLRARGRDQQRIRLQTDVKVQPPCRRKKFFQIPAQKNFAAAECQKKRSGLCELFQRVDAFRCGEFAVIFVIEIAMNAAFVAAVRQIEMNAQRQALAHGPRDQAVHQRRCRKLWSAAQAVPSPGMGSIVISNLRLDNSSRSSSVSASATCAGTSYCSARSAANSSALRRPSMLRHNRLPVSFNSCITLSAGEMITVSF